MLKIFKFSGKTRFIFECICKNMETLVNGIIRPDAIQERWERGKRVLYTQNLAVIS